MKEVGGRSFKKLLYDALGAILNQKDSGFLFPRGTGTAINNIQVDHAAIDTNDSSVV